ncbi:RNA-directed DNA polymerase, eukaryota [Tanacetum coccineum]
MNSVVLSSSKDRWTCDLSGDGEFKVKVIRNFIDDLFLPSSDVATRWVKFIPIKVKVFSWRARRDRLPTRVNLSRRGVLLDSICVLFVMLLWRMFSMFSFDVTWLGLFFVKFVVGGIWIGRRFVLSRIGMLGGNNSSETKKYQGSNSIDGGNTGDGVKIAGGEIRSHGGIGGSLAAALYAYIYGSS